MEENQGVTSPPEQRRGNNGWFYSYVYRLLTKRTVLGEYVTNKGEILAVDFFPQAISAEKWNRAQAALAMRKGNQTTTKANYNRNLLQGIVVCGECGGGAHFRHQIDKGQTYTKKNGEVITYKRNDHRRLRCDRARRKHNCSNGTILSYDVVEATVLNELLPRLVAKRTEAAAVAKLREQLAEIVRLRDADQNRLDNLIGVLEEGGPKAIVQRVAALQQQIEDRRKSIDLAQKALGIEMSKPSTESDAASLRALEADLDSEFDEVRTYARGRANMSLRRLLKRIVITPTDCFRIEPDDFSWWLFDAKGTMIEGSYVLE